MAPRTFSWNSPEPGPEVTYVRDSDGDVWRRVSAGWDGWECIGVFGTAGPGPVTDWPVVLLHADCQDGLVDCSAEFEKAADA